MKVSDLLGRKGARVSTIHPEKSLRSAMGVMIDEKIGALPVVCKDGGLVGIITERDIFRFLYHDIDAFGKKVVADIMTQELIVGIPEDDIEYIAEVMTKNRFRHVPIVEKEYLKGILSIGDIVKARTEDTKATNRYLMEYISGGPSLGIF
ncbi:MAG: CBS domain-containing protein [candidate division Zixibacteria bacterium]|nr:CBS domain-containing protein [candidate division Zixibacteria bacterium]